jgi:hypothetical protein
MIMELRDDVIFLESDLGPTQSGHLADLRDPE